MEKFGIFELLDALSALTERPEAAPSSAAEKKRPDASFAAPSYGADPLPPPAGEKGALDGFYARHERIRKSVKNETGR